MKTIFQVRVRDVYAPRGSYVEEWDVATKQEADNWVKQFKGEYDKECGFRITVKKVVLDSNGAEVKLPKFHKLPERNENGYAYKGYYLFQNSIDRLWYISKDGFHIATNKTEAGAKADVDLIA